MKQDEYDVIIIGAGIGGLVSSCFLAKHGLKVLVLEKNTNVGGFCNSFIVKNYLFDGCVHSLGNLAVSEEFYSIIEDLGIRESLNLTRHNPSDSIKFKGGEILFRNELQETVKNFAKHFPKQKDGIRAFFEDAFKLEKLASVVKYRNKTFSSLLNEYFDDEILKKIMSLPTYGNVGVAADQLNAFTAMKHYKNFLIDGGYYPKEGIQALPNALAKRIINWGGEISLSTPVEKILIKGGVAIGVRAVNKKEYSGRFIISSCNTRQTFFSLLDADAFNRTFLKRIEGMTPSATLFILYIGLNHCTNDVFIDRCNNWHILDLNFDKEESNKNINEEFEKFKIKWFMALPNYYNRTVLAFTSVPFVSNEFWKKNKKIFQNYFLNEIEKVAPGFSSSIIFCSSSSPITLDRWTSSYNGACYGWASTPTQFMDQEFFRDKVIKNLFFCSHWSTVTSGVSGVSILGRYVADIIYKRSQRMKTCSNYIYEK